MKITDNKDGTYDCSYAPKKASKAVELVVRLSTKGYGDGRFFFLSLKPISVLTHVQAISKVPLLLFKSSLVPQVPTPPSVVVKVLREPRLVKSLLLLLPLWICVATE